uniref:Uncharacterized protein n=2 Tax=Triticum urartu TaxID=4572 RepID=A0A8R7PSM1_TRIUA
LVCEAASCLRLLSGHAASAAQPSPVSPPSSGHWFPSSRRSPPRRSPRPQSPTHHRQARRDETGASAASPVQTAAGSILLCSRLVGRLSSYVSLTTAGPVLRRTASNHLPQPPFEQISKNMKRNGAILDLFRKHEEKARKIATEHHTEDIENARCPNSPPPIHSDTDMDTDTEIDVEIEDATPSLPSPQQPSAHVFSGDPGK